MCGDGFNAPSLAAVVESNLFRVVGEVGSVVGGIQTVRYLPVVSADVEPPALAEPPEAEECLEEVVGQDDSLQLEGFPVCHQPESVVRNTRIYLYIK